MLLWDFLPLFWEILWCFGEWIGEGEEGCGSVAMATTEAVAEKWGSERGLATEELHGRSWTCIEPNTWGFQRKIVTSRKISVSVKKRKK